MSRRWTISLLVLLTAMRVSADVSTAHHWFGIANAAYKNQEYDTAIAYYEKAIQSGTHNTAVYYNLGNAYYRTEKIGLALLNYERARRLSPHDPDVVANIRFANRHIIDRIPAPERGLLEAVLWRLHTFLPLRPQLWIGWGLLWILCALFSTGLFVSRNVRLWLIYLGSLTALALVALGISAGIKIHTAERRREAIVLETSIDARNQPDGDKVLFTAHEGTKFHIRKQNGPWLLVSLANGVSGWVERSALGEI